MKFALFIPTLNAGPRWGQVVEAIQSQSTRPDAVLVVDSGSVDGTAELASSAGFEVEHINPSEFDHGATRMLALQRFADCDVIVYLTQDAVPRDRHAFSHLLAALASDDAIAAVAGRQLPDIDASVFARHSRGYNYPDQSAVRSSSDIAEFGIKSAFLSNSFAAYDRAALEAVGGFPQRIIFGEDMYVAAKLLKAGRKVAYASDACVYHSHNYTPMQEFRRYFDMGVFHARECWLRREFGGAEGEGVKFVRSEIDYLLKHAFWRIPEGGLRTMFRYAGFRLGLIEKRLPVWLKMQLAMNKGCFKE
ncbi:MAG: glycosyltransferase [Gammaproteobacteria bacterium]|nr:glycosyltransferase [Gammaproteobacteria bacterium]